MPKIDIIQEIARSDAAFDGRPFDSLGRADRERYLARAKQSFNVTVGELIATFRPIKKMTAEEIVREMQSGSPSNIARQNFSFASARIEQATQQATPLTPIKMRQMEFDAAAQIVSKFLEAAKA